MKVGLGFVVATIVIVGSATSRAITRTPITIPLQAGVIGMMEPIPEGAPVVEARVVQATYRVPGRAVILKMRVNNRGPNPIQVAEFETAGIRFLNGSVYKDETNYPPQFLRRKVCRWMTTARSCRDSRRS